MAADRYNSSYPDDLVLPFVFVPHGEPERPEVAEFKARYPDWFAIPATFVPHPRPAEALAGPSRGLDTGHRRPVARRRPVREAEPTGTAPCGRSEITIWLATGKPAQIAPGRFRS